MCPRIAERRGNDITAVVGIFFYKSFSKYIDVVL